MVHIVLQDNKRKQAPSPPPRRPKRQARPPAAEPAAVELVDSESDDDIEVIELPDAPHGEKVSSDLKKLKCPVCLDHPDEMVAADCGHVYCYSCVFQALASTRRATQTFGECSVCRRRVRYDHVHYLQMYEKPAETAKGGGAKGD